MEREVTGTGSQVPAAVTHCLMHPPFLTYFPTPPRPFWGDPGPFTRLLHKGERVGTQDGACQVHQDYRRGSKCCGPRKSGRVSWRRWHWSQALKVEQSVGSKPLLTCPWASSGHLQSGLCGRELGREELQLDVLKISTLSSILKAFKTEKTQLEKLSSLGPSRPWKGQASPLCGCERQGPKSQARLRRISLWDYLPIRALDVGLPDPRKETCVSWPW